MAYSNQLGSLVGPGTQTYSISGNFSYYTPAWACVVMIMAGCMLIVGGFIHLGRAICIYRVKIQKTPEQDLQMINEIMRWKNQPLKMIEIDDEKLKKKTSGEQDEDNSDSGIDNETVLEAQTRGVT